MNSVEEVESLLGIKIKGDYPEDVLIMALTELIGRKEKDLTTAAKNELLNYVVMDQTMSLSQESLNFLLSNRNDIKDIVKGVIARSKGYLEEADRIGLDPKNMDPIAIALCFHAFKADKDLPKDVHDDLIAFLDEPDKNRMSRQSELYLFSRVDELNGLCEGILSTRALVSSLSPNAAKEGSHQA